MKKADKKILNIADFQVRDEQIFTLKGSLSDRIVSVFLDFEEEILLKHIIVPSIVLCGNVLWVYTKDGALQYLLNEVPTQTNKFSNYFPKFIKGEMMVGDYKEQEFRHLQARSTINESVFWSLTLTSTIISFHEKIYLIEFNRDLQKINLVTIDFQTGAVLWIYNLPETIYNWYQESPYEHQEPTLVKAEIARVIGVFEGVVWIMLNSGRLLGLDEQTGDIRFDLAYPINFSSFFPDLSTPFWLAQNTHLDIAAGKVFGIYNHYYWELDLTNPCETYILYDVEETCQQHQVLLNFWGGWNQDEIYFWEGSINNKVGVFSRTTKQIIWSTAIEEVAGKFPAIRKVDYQSNHLYVLDHHNSLHIFDRTY